jgi:hypothetical protein
MSDRATARTSSSAVMTWAGSANLMSRRSTPRRSISTSTLFFSLKEDSSSLAIWSSLFLEGLVDGDRVLEVEAALEVEAELEAVLEAVGEPPRQGLVTAEDLGDRRGDHHDAEGDQRQQQQRLGLEEATHGGPSSEPRRRRPSPPWA